MTMRTKLAGVGLAAAATIGMALATVEPASAQRGGFHGGGGGLRGGFGGGGFRGGRGFGGAFAGRGYGRGFGGGYGGRGYRYGGYGLATGLAFGALAASAYPYGYGGGYYGAGYGGYGGGYYGAGYGGGCYVEPRRVYGPYGVRIRQVQVCY